MGRSMRVAAHLAVGMAVLLAVAIAESAPIARYNWDRCEPFVRNRDFEGPGVYTQTLSITGVPAGTTRLVFAIDLYVDERYQAWEFYTGGCAGPARLTVASGAGGCDSIPGLAVRFAEMYKPADYTATVLEFECVLDASFVPDPARRYGIVTIRFDHELSGTACHGETAPLCFEIAGFYAAAGTFGGVEQENGRLTWNDHATEPDCSSRIPSPVRPSSWGRVKALYR
jgi:hypothetical protein